MHFPWQTIQHQQNQAYLSHYSSELNQIWNLSSPKPKYQDKSQKIALTRAVSQQTTQHQQNQAIYCIALKKLIVHSRGGTFQNFGGTFVSVSSTRFEFKSSYHWLSSKRQNVKVPSIGKFQDRKMESSYLSVHSKDFSFKVPS